MSQERAYAGIGSRETPQNILDTFKWFGGHFGLTGGMPSSSVIRLYSGGALGADMAFETGCRSVDGPMRIFLPWKGFGAKWGRVPHPADHHQPSADAMLMVKDLIRKHGDFSAAAPEWMLKLIARNMHQILGETLDTPVECVFCWTKGGQDVGGTRWAIRAARKHGIPVWNFGALTQDQRAKILKMNRALSLDTA